MIQKNLIMGHLWLSKDGLTFEGLYRELMSNNEKCKRWPIKKRLKELQHLKVIEKGEGVYRAVVAPDKYRAAIRNSHYKDVKNTMFTT